MAKKKPSENREDRARRKLAKSQGDLQAAQEKRRQVQVKGEQDVQQAQQRAARRLDKATKQVERRAAAVSRAENKLASSLPPNNPEAAAASLQTIEAERAQDQADQPLAVPGLDVPVEPDGEKPPRMDTW